MTSTASSRWSMSIIVSIDRALYDWTIALSWDALPHDIQALSKRCLLDLIGVAASGTTTELHRIIADYGDVAHGGSAARMLFQGRRVSAAGAALVNGMTIDAIDAHDGGRLTKGHSGCGTIAGLLALAEDKGLDDGQEFLTTLVIGYEIATRAGIALHGSVPDYHTSGAWVSLACAAMGCRLNRAPFDVFQHALGIAEYHGPRSQMMRCIDHPTMLKDGSGWGAMAGVSAYQLAAARFTGSPAITVTEQPTHWSDLGSRWHIAEQYFKPIPVCRWAQPAAQAVIDVKAAHQFQADEIASITIETFHEAVRLANGLPNDTEQAQYNIPWPVAVSAIKGTVGVQDVLDTALNDPATRAFAERIDFVETDEFNALFPEQRFARAKIVLIDGRTFISEATQATGDPETPLTDAQMVAKYHAFADPVIGRARAVDIRERVETLDRGASLAELLERIMTP